MDHGHNVKHKAIKIFKENVQESLQVLGLGKAFLNLTTKAQSLKRKIDKLDFIKLKTFSLQKTLLRG